MSAFSPRQMFLLDQSCKPIYEAFGQYGDIYLVGTSASRQEYRDVDVRLMVSDKRYDKIIKAMGRSGIIFISLAIGQYLASMTNLPIDFQIQRTTEANEHKGLRNPLGCRSLASYVGDAMPG